MSQQHLAIFGGTFNPIHFGHLKIAETAVNRLKLNKIYFVPTYISVHKDHSVVTFKHRLAMLRLALQNSSFVEISLLEFQRKGKSYTIDTIINFQKLHPSAKIYLIIGEDSFYDLPTWHRFTDIISIVEIIVVPRTLTNVNTKKPTFKADYLDFKPMDISATHIRDKIKMNQNLSNLLPESVSDYIHQHKIYQ